MELIASTLLSVGLFFSLVVFDAAESACWYLMVIDSPIIGGLFTVASLSFDGDISVPFSLC